MKRVEQGTSAAKASIAGQGAGVAVDADQRPGRPQRLGEPAGVAAAAEGAVDRGLAGLGRQQLDQLGGEDGFVLGGHIGKVCAVRSRVV